MRLLLISLALLYAAGCSHRPINAVQSADSSLERAVWRDFFALHFPGTDGHYIHLDSSTGVWGPYDAWKRGIEEHLSAELDDISSSTIASFVRRNTTSLVFPQNTEFTPGVVIDHSQ